MSEPPIGVVIPYYQREPGILTRALRSVASQRGVSNVHVVVVDDGSPVPAAVEVTHLANDFPFLLDVVEQRNGGPGAARNGGLDLLAGKVRWVAFLDSDDEWAPDHLARAIKVLSGDVDVYFADHMQLGADQTAFRRAGRLERGHHIALSENDDLYEYRGDMFNQILLANVIGTSTVVFDFKQFSGCRFRTEFRNAGEDYMFWMQLAAKGARFGFSRQCEAQYGAGVNVYSGAGWGTQQHFQRLHDEMKYRKAIGKLFPLSPVQGDFVASEIARLRLAVTRDMIHRARHVRPLPLRWLAAHARLDPRTFAELPFAAVRLLFHRRKR